MWILIFFLVLLTILYVIALIYYILNDKLQKSIEQFDWWNEQLNSKYKIIKKMSYRFSELAKKNKKIDELDQKTSIKYVEFERLFKQFIINYDEIKSKFDNHNLNHKAFEFKCLKKIVIKKKETSKLFKQMDRIYNDIENFSNFDFEKISKIFSLISEYNNFYKQIEDFTKKNIDYEYTELIKGKVIKLQNLIIQNITWFNNDNYLHSDDIEIEKKLETLKSLIKHYGKLIYKTFQYQKFINIYCMQDYQNTIKLFDENKNIFSLVFVNKVEQLIEQNVINLIKKTKHHIEKFDIEFWENEVDQYISIFLKEFKDIKTFIYQKISKVLLIKKQASQIAIIFQKIQRNHDVILANLKNNIDINYLNRYKNLTEKNQSIIEILQLENWVDKLIKHNPDSFDKQVINFIQEILLISDLQNKIIKNKLTSDENNLNSKILSYEKLINILLAQINIKNLKLLSEEAEYFSYLKSLIKENKINQLDYEYKEILILKMNIFIYNIAIRLETKDLLNSLIKELARYVGQDENIMTLYKQILEKYNQNENEEAISLVDNFIKDSIN